MNNAHAPASLTLDPYTGSWGFPQAGHLLRRTMFGATSADINTIQAMTMSAAVDLLLADQAAPADAPVVWYHNDDAGVLDGETWIHLGYSHDYDFRRSLSLIGWYTNLLLTQKISIVEKMTLFWHNHFSCGVADVGDARYTYFQNVLLRANALGNFKSLAKSITLDPAMLRYLSGNVNIASAPNENYGRELQELFTIGKGPEASSGDYTTYTEADVKAAAHVLTGWSDDPNTITPVFTAANHDPSDKLFSARYGNQIIKGASDQTGAEREIDDLLTMIFSQTATAQYLCRKIFRWFVDYEIDATIEQNVIVPLAQTLIANNFEIKPVLSQLFKSSLFYDPAFTGCIIKTPLDLVIGSIRTLGVVLTNATNIASHYYAWVAVENVSAILQMALLEPPNVAGWPEYYEAPQYHEIWINSATLDNRIKFVDEIATNQFPVTPQPSPTMATVDLTQLIQQLSDPTDPNTVITDLVSLLYPNPLTSDQTTTLHDMLVPQGLPDYEWTTVWAAFVADPTIAMNKEPVTTKLTALLKYMVELAEYQLT